MKIGIGLPNTVPGTEGGEMREWAMRAEAAGFSTLGTIDRIVYANHEPLTSLAYAAAVTERIGLLSSILIAPLRANAALLDGAPTDRASAPAAVSISTSVVRSSTVSSTRCAGSGAARRSASLAASARNRATAAQRS